MLRIFLKSEKKSCKFYFLSCSMNCPNSKVIRAVHSLMSRLINTFPTEPFNSPVASKYEELEQLYASVSKVIYEGLTNYEKNIQVQFYKKNSKISAVDTLYVVQLRQDTPFCVVMRNNNVTQFWTFLTTSHGF